MELNASACPTIKEIRTSNVYQLPAVTMTDNVRQWKLASMENVPALVSVVSMQFVTSFTIRPAASVHQAIMEIQQYSAQVHRIHAIRILVESEHCVKLTTAIPSASVLKE